MTRKILFIIPFLALAAGCATPTQTVSTNAALIVRETTAAVGELEQAGALIADVATRTPEPDRSALAEAGALVGGVKGKLERVREAAEQTQAAVPRLADKPKPWAGTLKLGLWAIIAGAGVFAFVRLNLFDVVRFAVVNPLLKMLRPKE